MKKAKHFGLSGQPDFTKNEGDAERLNAIPKTRSHLAISRHCTASEAEYFSQLVGPPQPPVLRSSGPGRRRLEGTACQGQQRGAGSTHGGPQTPARPNTSVNRSPNGRPPSPGRWYAVHFHRPGLGVLPLVPGYLER
jgi:hypothetical protein